MKRQKTKRETPDEVRGVPYSEYRTYARAVRAGKWTWAELERKGYVKPNSRHTPAYRKLLKAKGR